MEETIEFYKNDTVRSIERITESVKQWQSNGGYANPRETALVITKLEEARMWALQMVKRDPPTKTTEECDYCEGMGTRTVSVEQENGRGSIEKEECGKCRGTGELPAPTKTNKQ